MYNNAKALFDQQTGFSYWKKCDIPIRQLRCKQDNTYSRMFMDDERGFDTPIFACKFALHEGYEDLVAFANEDGKLVVHNTKDGSKCSTQAHNNAVFDVAWTFNNLNLATASGDHTVNLYDLNAGDIRRTKTFFGHTRSVKSVAFQKHTPHILATGGRDGYIYVWDTRGGDYTCILENKIANSHSHKKQTTPSKPKKTGCNGTGYTYGVKSVTGLVFQDENTMISCGAGDGIIKVWDMRKYYSCHVRDPVPKYAIPYPGTTCRNGYSCLMIDKECMKLYANCLDHNIYCFNLSQYNPKPIMCYTGFENYTFYIKSSLSKDGNYLLSGSSNDNAYIWDVKYPRPFVKLVGHLAEVTCVAWCQNNYNDKLITCSDDMTHKIWTMSLEDSDEEYSGKAEVLPWEHSQNKRILKRVQEEAPHITPKKLLLACSKCDTLIEGEQSLCETCSKNSALKRKNTNELSSENKRLNCEFGPRRLFSMFSSSDERVPSASDKRLDAIKEENNENIPFSNENLPRSPTMNLPNFVVDGTAPHLNYSPTKPKPLDWLSKLRIERNFRREMQQLSTEPKIPKLDLTPKRVRPVSNSPLLKYFKVTNNVNKCDGHGGCSPRAQSSSLFSSSPRSSQ